MSSLRPMEVCAWENYLSYKKKNVLTMSRLLKSIFRLFKLFIASIFGAIGRGWFNIFGFRIDFIRLPLLGVISGFLCL